ncbi:MAG: hypothetical protein V7642_2146, partial [Burkholderiales bacterium]
LIENKCDAAQGYAIGHAIPAEDLPGWISGFGSRSAA